MRAPARPTQPGRRSRAGRAAIVPDDHEIVQSGDPASLRALIDLCSRYLTKDDLHLIYRAYCVAAAAHGSERRRSGELFIEHPLAVAGLMAEVASDADGIAAALLHDVVEDTSVAKEDVERDFGPTIAEIVDGVTKFTAVEAGAQLAASQLQAGAAKITDAQAVRESKARQQLETVRKLFGAMLRDPRVAMLKLADRLHNLRTMAVMEPHKRVQKSRETLDIYAPLAGRIGLYLWKIELEDLAFLYLYPEDFKSVSARLAEVQAQRRGWAERMSERMRAELAEKGISAAVNWRMKRAYSAFLDSRQSQIEIGALDDVIAFRVIVNTPVECYQSLGAIHGLWKPYPDSFRDYIATPKVNGYKSLHTTVFGSDGRLAQIHIRTHKMHVATQHGVAAQWLERALRHESGPLDMQQWIKGAASWVGRIANWHTELNLSASDFVDTVRGEMFTDQVFVFTPKGDVHELAAGATALDLAYRIHTGLGDTAIGAWALTTTEDSEPLSMTVPLSYPLRNGDVVTILRDPNSHPQVEWLDIAHTRYALERIKRSLARLRRAGVPLGERPYTDEPTAETEPEQPDALRHPSGRPADVTLARCCCPIPGDAIAGLAFRGRSVVIHRTCCRTLATTVRRRREGRQPYAAPLHLKWIDIPQATYLLCLNISGRDSQGLMFELSDRVTKLGLSIIRNSASANQDREGASISMALGAPVSVRPDEVMRKLFGAPGVLKVERVLGRGCDGGE